MELNITGVNIEISSLKNLILNAEKWYDRISLAEEPLTGWASLPTTTNQKILDQIKLTAKEIKDKCSLFVVIGVGGSYLGAKAVIDALNGSRDDFPEVIFAGYNMSAAYLHKIVDRMKNEATCICVISKSGGTTEPLLTYSILKDKMYSKYGIEEAKKRIFVVTDAKTGGLREEAEQCGYKSFAVPDDVGGRYSVLSPVGLLPVAVAGHDIDKLLAGAADISRNPDWKHGLLGYTIARLALQEQGKKVEIFEYFEANLGYFGEWLKQLFGESEGKDGKGVYPTCLCFSRDLHSMGQFLQQGSQIFYETLIRIKESNYDFEIPDCAGEPFAGKTLEQINECSEKGVISAHTKGGVPIMTIEIPKLNEFYLGQLIFFFEMSCAISAYCLGVNPFNQPGVEYYKREMRRLVEEI